MPCNFVRTATSNGNQDSSTVLYRNRMSGGTYHPNTRTNNRNRAETGAVPYCVLTVVLRAVRLFTDLRTVVSQRWPVKTY